MKQDKTQTNEASSIILDGHKVMWHQDRVQAWLKGERIAPITIDCSLTRKCTYRCTYCYGQLQANDEKQMSRDVIYRFLDDAAEIGVKGISFVSDGESTCSPYLYDAILHGFDNGLSMALGTNGYLLKQNRLEDILPALTYIRFNISAGEPDRYAEIHGVSKKCFNHVCDTIRKAVAIKNENDLDVTIGMQMVLMPEFRDQIMPLAYLGDALGVDYLVIKHCSDDENHSLGVDYSKYNDLIDDLEEAETLSTDTYMVRAKWSKILSGGTRNYSRCYGPPFILQLSGSGLVAPCGMLFNSKYDRYHIGNIAQESFKEIWQSDRYWEVMGIIGSDKFNAKTMCGSLCLQHKVNEFLWDLRENNVVLEKPSSKVPMHLNFI